MTEPARGYTRQVNSFSGASIRTYWTLVGFVTLLMSCLAFLQLSYLISAVAVPLAAWFGTKLTSEHLRRLRTTEVRITLFALIGSAVVIGLGAFFKMPLLWAAGLVIFLTPLFASMASDIDRIDACPRF